ncbi:MAG: hypothetical protein LLG06_00015 [Desulfobacteraceae bacterium]|nr:hypothetical protein [Desulfobacteraceae bacterium]
MAKVLDLNEGRRRLAAKKGFEPWSRRFGIGFDDSTSIRRLEHHVIGFLIPGGEESAMALYELIMAIKGLGPGPRFQFLENENKLDVTDITLLLLDLLRFEAMFRLEWLEDYPLLKVPLLDLVQRFEDNAITARQVLPRLSAAHPHYPEYLAEFEGDRNIFIRKLIPEAIKVYCARHGDAEKP